MFAVEETRFIAALTMPPPSGFEKPVPVGLKFVKSTYLPCAPETVPSKELYPYVKPLVPFGPVIAPVTPRLKDDVLNELSRSAQSACPIFISYSSMPR